MSQPTEQYQPRDSYLRVAAACPEVSVADVATNVERITELYREAAAQDVSLVTFPELSITGYTLGDLVHQNNLLDRARQGLVELAETTKGQPTAMVVGLPLQVGNCLYNCAAVVTEGRVQGIAPKIHLPNYNEFYEQRWYAGWDGPDTTVLVNNQEIPFGTNLLFNIGDTLCGLETCEELWVMKPPSADQAAKGALVIANASASPEQVGKAAYRRELVASHSARLFSAYLYAGSHTSESTAEIVMGGHQMIGNNGKIVAERRPFGEARLIVADIDIDHLRLDRRKQHAATMLGAMVIETGVRRRQQDLLTLPERNPFLPAETAEQRAERLETALTIQAQGLATRLRSTGHRRIVLGLSGGLDSTHAFLVACRAAEILGLPPSDMIHTLTMPGPASSEDTQSNAQLLAKQLGIPNTVIRIDSLVNDELRAISHDGTTQDVTYENVQARLRTSLLFNYANKNQAIVLGTGDLSEIALGWNTYNGDQQSHYNVNASIPKTMVRHLVAHQAAKPEYASVRDTLGAILDTVISPELTKQPGLAISQSTESLVGPYELHDFFLHAFVRWSDAPAKIAFLAEQVFADTYPPDVVRKWLGVFISRFIANQFKRENMPNGPKIGSVSLSPRGDWRMPPDLRNAAIWQ